MSSSSSISSASESADCSVYFEACEGGVAARDEGAAMTVRISKERSVSRKQYTYAFLLGLKLKSYSSPEHFPGNEEHAGGLDRLSGVNVPLSQLEAVPPNPLMTI
jgi:hypothetical protein